MTPTLAPAATLLILAGFLQPFAAFAPIVPIAPLATAPGGAPWVVDLDRDGVSDEADGCPGTPAGYPVTAEGCAKDTDGDGVSDGADRCPDTRPTRGGIDPTVDASGCSVRDTKRERPFPYSLAEG